MISATQDTRATPPRPIGALQSGDLLRALAVSVTRYANDNAISMTEAMNRLLYAGEAR